jgi:hypothetical protein
MQPLHKRYGGVVPNQEKKGARNRILPSVLPPNTFEVQRAYHHEKCKLDCRKKLVGKTVQEILSFTMLSERAPRVWGPNKKAYRSARDRRFNEKKMRKRPLNFCKDLTCGRKGRKSVYRRGIQKSDARGEDG